MSHVNLRWEIGPLMFSIREILEKIWHYSDDWLMIDDNFAFKKPCMNLNGMKCYLVVE